MSKAFTAISLEIALKVGDTSCSIAITFFSHVVSSVDTHMLCTLSHKTQGMILCNNSLGRAKSLRGTHLDSGSDRDILWGGIGAGRCWWWDGV